ncbi:MAG: acyl-ACP thioesterase domain-containing protein [Sphaerochaetaceae bacterium]
MILNSNIVGSDNVLRMRFMTYTYETDPHYNARLAFYFGIVQDAAGLHAACRHLSIPELQEQGKTWVILRSKMKILRYTAWPEDVLAETWAQQPLGFHMPRVVRGYDEQHKPLFEAMTQWAILDLQHNFRPVRPQEITATLGIPSENDNAHYINPTLEKRIQFEASGSKVIFTYSPIIHLLDTDGNHHVNNISYLNWVLDSLPNGFRNDYKVDEIDVSWIRQTFLGEHVRVFTGSPIEKVLEQEEPLLYHKIVRTEEDGSETIVWEGMTHWKKRSLLVTTQLV